MELKALDLERYVIYIDDLGNQRNGIESVTSATQSLQPLSIALRIRRMELRNRGRDRCMSNGSELLDSVVRVCNAIYRSRSVVGSEIP